MRGNNKLIFPVLGVIVLAGAFWMLLLSPKRDEASKLGAEVETLQATLSQHEAEAQAALTAKQEFPSNYSQVVVLGKAVPAESETASLLVQVQKISERAGVRFEEISLDAETSEGSEAPLTPPAEAPTESVSPTEVAASTMPLGAGVGPAGLGVMPYTLTFTGNFFQISRFIRGLDNLVKTTNSKVSVDGRLITVDAFSLTPPQEGGAELQATFSVTTYLTPPEQGLTAGATLTGPATATATPASATTEGTP